MMGSVCVPRAVEALQKLLKDGTASGAVDETDGAFLAVKALLSSGRTWLARYAASQTALKVTPFTIQATLRC